MGGLYLPISKDSKERKTITDKIRYIFDKKSEAKKIIDEF